MQHYFNQKDIQINTEKGSVVALGKFDGFHQGHKLLLDEVLRLQKDGYTGVVFTDRTAQNKTGDRIRCQTRTDHDRKTEYRGNEPGGSGRDTYGRRA